MKQKRDSIAVMKLVLLTLFVALFAVACTNSGDNSATNSAPTEVDGATEIDSPGQDSTTDTTDAGASSVDGYPGAMGESGYPGVGIAGSADPGYPGASIPEDALPEPPNPERDIPAPGTDAGAVGGVLIREVSGAGFLPVTPLALYLGEVLTDSQGRQALIAQGDDSPQAQLLPTGVFIFNNVQPGTYGLVIDIGVSQFPITGEDGLPLLIEVEADKAIDLGQVFVELPSS